MQFKHILFAFINGLKSPRDGPDKMPKKRHQSEFFYFFNKNNSWEREQGTVLGLILVTVFALLSFISLPADCYKICFLQHYHKIVKRRTANIVFYPLTTSNHVTGIKNKEITTNANRHMAGTSTLSGFDSHFDPISRKSCTKIDDGNSRDSDRFAGRGKGCWLGPVPGFQRIFHSQRLLIIKNRKSWKRKNITNIMRTLCGCLSSHVSGWFGGRVGVFLSRP